MKCVLFLIVAGFASSLWSQEVGQGAPAGVAQQFIQAYFRNGFNALTSATPQGTVRSYGAGGYIQEFQDAKKTTGVTFALVKGSEAADPVFQVYPALFSYLGSVGVSNTGLPLNDTSGCGAQASTAAFCTYQLFESGYALFAYTSSLTGAENRGSYSVSGTMYTRWAALGSITGLGAATGAEAAVTSKTGITATAQPFTAGALYSLSSGAFTGRVFPVRGKAYTLYSSLGLHNGALGIPISEELAAPGGKTRQNFEGGQIEYSNTTDPIVRPAVGGVQLSIATADVTRMNVGDSLTIRVSVVATTGEPLLDREVAWTTSNSRVVSVTPSAGGASAVLKAAGGGTAILTAVSEGKASERLTIFVSSPCCQIGEGAPTAAMQQSFQDAVTRQRLNVKLPAANPVARVGIGYVQELTSADSSQRYLLCRSDRSPGVFVVGGDLLRAYELEGGPAGKTGYPTADATAGGRQVFEGGVLAGSPVYLVTGAIAARWAALGFEAGALGPPVSAPAAALSFRGASGTLQSFRGGALVSEASAGRTFVVSGPVQARYFATGGIGGPLGLPLGEEYARDGRRRQDFEGGSLHYAPGDGEAEIEELERRPQITVNPSRVTAGGRVRIAVGGFPSQAALRVTLAGQGTGGPFTVQTQNGSYVWEAPVALDTPSGFVTIRAQEVGGAATAAGTYTVTALEEAAPRLTKLRGDTQTGLPGARLLVPLAVSLKDADGAPLVGVPVAFAASPGARIAPDSMVTDENGEAQSVARLQTGDGIALFTASAAGAVVTFSARSNGVTLQNYPRQMQSGNFSLGASQAPVTQKGALLAAVSSMIRYFQNRSELPSSLGLSDPAALNDFLKTFCPLDVAGGRICDGYVTISGDPVVNLWRLRDFAGGLLNVQVVRGGEEGIRDALAEGKPVLLALRLSSADAVLGSHFVVATGADIDGGLAIHDPNPTTNRTRLNDYLAGLRLAGREVKGEVMDAITLTPQSPSPTGFLVTASGARLAVRSRLGACGQTLDWPNAAVIAAGGAVAAAQGSAQLHYCEGTQQVNSLQLSGAGATVTDLGSPGRQSPLAVGGEYLLTRPTGQWQADAMKISLAASDVGNAATFTRDLAPGTLAAVYGTGLARPGQPTRVEVGGREARIQSADEFRILVEIPVEIPPGEHSLSVQSPLGTAEVALRVMELAPFIFVDEAARTAAVGNADGKANTPLHPASRGETVTILATGLGSVTAAGTVTRAVAVAVQGIEYPAGSAVLSAGMPGVYVVTAVLPAEATPGLSLGLQLRVDGVDSNRVEISVR